MITITHKKETERILYTIKDIEEYIKSYDKYFLKLLYDFSNYLNDKINSNLSISRNDFIYLIRKLYKEKLGRSICSTRSIQFYTIRGWTINDAKNEISIIQKRGSIFSVQHWLHKGFYVEEAKEKVRSIQSSNSKKCLEKYTKEELRSFSYRCPEYWMRKGYTEKESKKIISKNSDTGSLKYFINKHGNIKGNELYKERCKKVANFGPDNAQYGQPAPKGSGNGISGYYKNYYFRSLLEYSFMKMLENNKLLFKCNDVNKKEYPEKVIIRLPSGRSYTPDFIIENSLVEVKSNYNLSLPETIEKTNAGYKYIERSKLLDSYLIFTEKNIIQDDVIMLQDYDNKLLVIDKGKLKRFSKHIEKIRRKNESDI